VPLKDHSNDWALDYIDLYILHTWDQLTPAAEVMRTLNDLVRSGKVRHIGLSDTSAWYGARAQTLAEWRGYEPLSTLQGHPTTNLNFLIGSEFPVADECW
jgi:aryl-alcohol dehydrogenase-like predicted oxidoreductase